MEDTFFKIAFSGQRMDVFAPDGARIPCVGTTTLIQDAGDCRKDLHRLSFDIHTNCNLELGKWHVCEANKELHSIEGVIYPLIDCKVLRHLIGPEFEFTVSVLAKYNHDLCSKEKTKAGDA